MAGLMLRVGSLLVLLISLSACVLGVLEDERTNRGGFVDAVLDKRWMAADTNQMRTLRAYLLIGSIARLRRDIYHKTERPTMVAAMNSSIRAANEVFSCAYAAPGKCVFFDERMIELESTLLRLLILTISTEENQDLSGILNREFSKTLPAWKAVESLSKFADAFNSTFELVASSGAVVTSLVKFGEIGLTYGRRVGALYRDSLELEMITVLQSFDTMCAVTRNSLTDYDTNTGQYMYAHVTDKSSNPIWLQQSGWAYLQFYGWPREQAEKACNLFIKGHNLWSRGAGDLKSWRAFLDEDVKPFRPWIVPTENAFIQASDLIWRACETIAGSSTELSQCLGRVVLKDDASGDKKDEANRQCVVDYDDNGEVKKITGEPKATNKSDKQTDADSEKNSRVWNDRCKLILFWQTWEYRKNRSERANARIDWLSSLAPSVGHPAEARGWSRTPTAPPPKKSPPFTP